MSLSTTFLLEPPTVSMTDHPTAQLRAIATAVPDHALSQADALSLAESVFGSRFDAFDSLKPVFANAGIAGRRLAMPVDWYP